jgi:hypothetical protein
MIRDLTCFVLRRIMPTRVYWWVYNHSPLSHGRMKYCHKHLTTWNKDVFKAAPCCAEYGSQCLKFND